MRSLGDLDLEELENLLQKNREIQQEVKSSLQMLMNELHEAIEIRVRI
jgi:DnaJ-domain-containing protein 1